MHLPDGLLDLGTAGTTAALSASGIFAALRRLRDGLPRRKVPLMGLAAAFLFTAQMLNFPIAGGTSGHLVGAVLAAVLLGPSAAMVVMTAVLLAQCFLFADGGLLALGANVLNMAIVAVLGGFAVYRALLRVLPGPRGVLAAAAFASWCSTVLAAVSCAAELAWSGVTPWKLVFPAMASVYMLVGVGEAIITTLVIAALLKARPELVPGAAAPPSPARARPVVASGLAVAVGLLLFGIPFASSSPDGLERVAEALGFAHDTAPLVPAPLQGYRLPGLEWATAATAVAGFLGTLTAFALAYALATTLAPKADGETSRGGG
jgi:cobalt/nickel transport system permease protein